jgi:antitoxin VapB
MSGNSQAVRIPAELRLEADQVEITRTPEGNLILRPLPQDRGEAFLQALEGFDSNFVAALEDDRADQPPMQDRERL